jgi:toxin-antitoxin system PIN domain toxin
MPKFSRLFLFPDVNVWIALTLEGHIHHAAAKRWYEALDQNARLCFCRFTQLSLLRLLTTEALMGKTDVMNQVEAWETYDRWLEDWRVLLIDEPHGLESSFRSLSQLRQPAAKDWADSYLAAFASVSGFRLVTFDRAFERRTRDLVIL